MRKNETVVRQQKQWGGNKMTTLEVQTFFQPLPDRPDKIYETEMPLVGTLWYED